MSYFDLAGSLSVIEVVPAANYLPDTYSPTWTAGVCSDVAYTNESTCVAADEDWTAAYFTYAMDVRPYIGALFILTVETIGASSWLDVDLQSAAEPTFGSWATLTDTAGADADFARMVPGTPGAGEAADNAVYYCRVDFSKAQNAVGCSFVVGGSGSNRARFGVNAVCFPYDTTDSTEPQFEV